MEFTKEEKSEIFRNEKEYPEIARILKAINKLKFDSEINKYG